MYYRVDKNLQIDLDFISDNFDNNCKAFFFIDYFGFPHNKETNDFIINLKGKGVTIIQDIVQSFFPLYELIGDYCFNSFRKYIPVDGSIILCNSEINIVKTKSRNKYSLYKHFGRLLRYVAYYTNVDLSKVFLKYLNKAESYYYDYTNTNLTFYNNYLIKKIDLAVIRENRRTLFERLLNDFYNLALFKELPENVTPLGFPIIVGKRDSIKKKLANMNIYCPVHWELPHDLPNNTYPESLSLSQNILTLPLNCGVGESVYLKYAKFVKGVL